MAKALLSDTTDSICNDTNSSLVSVIQLNNLYLNSNKSTEIFYSLTSYFNEIENGLFTLNSVKSLEILNNIFNKLKDYENVSFSYIQLSYIQLLTILLKTLLKMNIPIERFCTNAIEIYSSVIQKENLDSLNTLFIDLFEKFFSICKERKTIKLNNVICKSIDYIYKNLDKELTLVDVSKYVALNPSYFSRFFKKETGICFVGYVKDIKINEAKKLLKTTNKKIYEICDNLGYQSVQYFSTLFKTEVGMTPLEYKKNG